MQPIFHISSYHISLTYHLNDFRTLTLTHAVLALQYGEGTKNCIVLLLLLYSDPVVVTLCLDHHSTPIHLQSLIKFYTIISIVLKSQLIAICNVQK